MDTRQRPSLSELKVGLFVVITSLILALAIFTIGQEAGLLQDTFIVKTYLNNVSGLKKGDIVLLAGVDVGNVTDVRVTEAEQEMPKTQSNQLYQKQLQELRQKASEHRAQIHSTQERLAVLGTELEATQDRQPAAINKLEKRMADLEKLIEDQGRSLDDIEEDIQRTRANLQNIEVYMEIIGDYRRWIRRDSNISLGSVGLLGDKYIEISLGRSPEPADTLRELRNKWLGLGQGEVEIVQITGTTQAGFRELITGANDILANFEGLSSQFEGVLDRLASGEGTIGKFFADPSFYNNLDQTILGARATIAKTSQLMEDISRGEGTIPRLIQEREVYNKIDAFLGKLESVMTRIDEGEGTLGKFSKDPSLYNKSAQAVANVEQITQRMDSGQGTLGKLSTDDKLYMDMQRSVDQLATFLTKIGEGKGTLGRLANDDQLYQSLTQVSSEIVKLIYDFRQNPKKFLTLKFELF